MAALATLADAVLSATIAELVGDGIVVPVPRYVHAGEVAFDCEALVVSVEGLAPALTGRPSLPSGPGGPVTMHMTTLAVWLIRCVPIIRDDGTPPSAVDLHAAGLTMADDVWALPRALLRAHAVGDFATACSSFSLTGTEVVGPSGGFAATVTRAEVQVP